MAELERFLDKELVTGLVLGGLALVVGAGAGTVWRRDRGQALPAVGLLAAGAVMVALVLVRSVPAGLVLGLVALALAGLVVDIGRAAPSLVPVLAVPGALLVAIATSTKVDAAAWVKPFLVLTVVVGGSLVADFDRRLGHRGYGPALLAVTAFGVFATVPDTERALVVLGVVAPLALLGWPVLLGSLGVGGSLAVTGVLAWVVGTEGVPRESAVVGGAACLGLLVVEPLGRLLAGGGDSVPAPSWRWWTVAPVGAAHVVLVYVASRVAGLRSTAGEALVIGALDLGIGIVAAAALAKRDRRQALREATYT